MLYIGTAYTIKALLKASSSTHMTGSIVPVLALLFLLLSASLSTMGFTTDYLLALRRPTSEYRLQSDTMHRLRELGIAAIAPTKRGCRAGIRVKQQLQPIPIHISETRMPQKRSKLGICKKNLIYVQRSRSTTKASEQLNVSLGLLNARSVNNKTTLLSEYVSSRSLDLCAITETWLTPGDDPVVNALCPDGYSFVGAPRLTRGGGVGLLHRSALPVHQQQLPGIIPKTFEVLPVTIDGPKPVSLFLVYRPPPSHRNKLRHADFMPEIEQFLAYVAALPCDICVLGDFNVHYGDSQDPTATQFAQILTSLGLRQHVRSPTHNKGHTLDLLITREKDTYLCMQSVSVINTHISDHFEVMCSIHVAYRSVKCEPRVCRKLRRVNNQSLAEDLTVGLSKLPDSEDPQGLLQQYNDTITSVLDRVAPEQTIKSKDVPLKPWYSDSIHEERMKRRRLERRMLKHPLEINKQLFIEQRARVVALIDRAKSEYYRGALQEADTKQAFKLVSNLLKNDMGSQIPSGESNLHIANEFANFFSSKVGKIRAELDSVPVSHGIQTVSSVRDPLPSPLILQEVTEEDVVKLIKKCPTKSCALDVIPTWLLKDEKVLAALVPHIVKLINASIAAGSVPDAFKVAHVTPILKKQGLDIDNMKNFRPVSNLSFVSKVLERVLAKQLTSHMDRHKLHDHLQSAYRPKHSTESALIKIKADIDLALDKGQGVLLLLLDLSAAFDTLDHHILLERLRVEIGVEGTTLDWFRSYLASRSQMVVIGRAKSEPVSLTIGVPQGSVLGPLLFLIYVLPLHRLISSFHIMRHGYADDSQLYDTFSLKELPSSLNSTITRMEQCAVSIKTWMQTNKLKLNDDKSELMLITPKHYQRSLEKLQSELQVGDATIKPTESVRNLGAYFDSTLSMDRHVSAILKSVYYHLRRVAKIRHHLDSNTAAAVINALITSRLDLNNALLLGTSSANIKRLQLAQNSAARLLSGSRKHDHITPILAQLHWLPVPKRILFKTLSVIYQAIHDPLAPAYLQEMLTEYAPRRSLRSEDSYKQLVVPRVRSSYGNRAFSTAGAKAWNELPQDLRKQPSLQAFKKKLKAYLF